MRRTMFDCVVREVLLLLLALPSIVAAESSEVVVTVKDNSFDPPVVNVTPGTTVVWKNFGLVFHTVTSTVSSTGDAFNAPLDGWGVCKDQDGAIVPCESRYTFPASGAVLYRCIPHQLMGMWGVVIVD